MPFRSKGPRLYLRRARRDKEGEHAAIWIIRDGTDQQSTGCATHDIAGAERALAKYLASKHATAARQTGSRDPDQIPIADVLTLYLTDIVPCHSRPDETKGRIMALDRFFGDRMLSYVTGETCRAYAAQRSTDAAARRELEDLRAAINYHRRENLHDRIVSVVLPAERPPRDRWLTRPEAARLILSAWRYREVQKGKRTGRRSRQHDLERGVFYRRPAGRRETKKRQPPVPLPAHLTAHLRRWKRHGQRFAVEWNGEPVRGVKKAFANVVSDAGLGDDVTPHVLRHTAATWLMQAGTDMWEAAGYLGMTVEMLSARYGHHHPDYLSGATRAFRRHREAVAEAVAGRDSV